MARSLVASVLCDVVDGSRPHRADGFGAIGVAMHAFDVGDVMSDNHSRHSASFGREALPPPDGAAGRLQHTPDAVHGPNGYANSDASSGARRIAKTAPVWTDAVPENTGLSGPPPTVRTRWSMDRAAVAAVTPTRASHISVEDDRPALYQQDGGLIPCCKT